MSALLAAPLLLGACNWFSAPDDRSPIVGTPPQQLIPASGPRILLVPDSNVLVVEITALDSAFHASWLSSRIAIETSRGHHEELQMAPHACLVAAHDRSDVFPYNFDWLMCDRIGLIAGRTLTDVEIDRIERTVSGRLVFTRVFQSMPGALYEFQVPIGVEAVAEALRRLASLRPFDDVHHPTRYPLCYLSDIVPPPSCPPWTLALRRAYSRSDAPADSLPVESGGWVEARYTDSEGVAHIARIAIP